MKFRIRGDVVVFFMLSLLLTACASTPATAGRHIEGAQPERHENICSGSAIALYALTKPWGLKNCISGEN